MYFKSRPEWYTCGERKLLEVNLWLTWVEIDLGVLLVYLMVYLVNAMSYELSDEDSN